MDECKHGLTPSTCSVCKHGPDVPGWGAKAKRRRIPPRTQPNRLAAICGMIGVDPRFRSERPNADATVPEWAPKRDDVKYALRARTPDNAPSPRPYPRMGGAKGKALPRGMNTPGYGRQPGR